MEIAFVHAPRQNRFFLELMTALRDEVERAGVATSLHHGSFPPPREDLVYALLPPHEYFTLMHGRIGPDEAIFRRTMFICAEQPGSHWFEWNTELARRGGEVLFDINQVAVREYRRLGVAAEHLQLGWTPSWDRLDEDAERDIDVLFMGCATRRRLELLSRYSPTLWRRRCHFVLSDNSRTNWQPSGSFVAGDDKWKLLNRSKVLINLHQDEFPYFEWLRVVQAISNGCAVVSEVSLDHAPLVPGRQFLTGRPETLGLLAELLVDDDDRRARMCAAAHDFLRDELTLAPAGRKLAEAARRLAERPPPAASSAFFLQPPPADEGDDAAPAEPVDPIAGGDDDVRRVLKNLKLDIADLRRSVDRLARSVDGVPPPRIVVDRRSKGYAAARPRISVLVTLHNYADHIAAALESVARSTIADWELIVVDDASTDDSNAAVRRWLDRHEGAPVLLLRHPVNRGLAHARNAALAFARGELCFVLDADNEVYPNCLQRLAAALDADPAPAFAYGLLERWSARGSVGLVDIYPWDPVRLRAGNYIDAMALIRTERLRTYGGYRLDRRLHGWEDYDLWCRMAEAGDYGVQLKTVVARYRMSDHSMLSLTNISVAEARSVIAERSPNVMAGVVAD